MRTGLVVTGVVGLAVGAGLGGWAWANRDYYTKVVAPGTRTVKVVDLAAAGPGGGHRVALTDFQLGDPVVVGPLPGRAFADVYFPVYPAARGKPKGPPPVLIHSYQTFKDKAEAAAARQARQVEGTVVNGLPCGTPDVPPEVAAAFPGLNAGAVVWVKGEGVWQETGVVVAIAGAGVFAVFGLLLAGYGLVVKPTAKVARVPATETRGRPHLRPLDERTSPLASRPYVHPACGTTTIVSGDDLVRLECPFRPCTGTYCVGCQKHFPMGKFRWADTGENIDAYRARLAGLVGWWEGVRLTLLANAYEGAINLGLDADGRVVQPLLDPPGEELETAEAVGTGKRSGPIRGVSSWRERAGGGPR